MPRKVDSVQRGLVTLLIAHGCSWQPTTVIGKGCPDGVIGYLGIDSWVEFKDPKAMKRKSPTVDAQTEWRRKWKGGTCWVICDWEGCVRMLESMRRRAEALARFDERDVA